MSPAGGQKRRLVGQVREVRADHSGRGRCERVEVHRLIQRNRARVHLEDLASPYAVRGLHGDAPVEAARPEQGGVQHVRAVAGSKHDDRLGRLEAVEFGEDLVECLLALVVGAGDRHRPLA